MYLVEPMRLSTTVFKFSGTLGSSHGRDQRTATVTAFTHFVMEDTACQYLFADIQGAYDSYHCAAALIIISGSNDKGSIGQTALVLFDPMTHTPLG